MIRAENLIETRGIAHGFFGREGGRSGGIYASLNCGFGSSDDKAAVAANRGIVAAALGLAPAALRTVHQVHGRTVARPERPWSPPDAPKADAMVTDRPGIALGILTADCAPLLLADPDKGVIGAAHAGWKGALDGVAQATVAAMRELGADPTRMIAAIGPCIAQVSYEVGAAFPEPFLAQDPNHTEFFAPGRDGRHQFDLTGYVAAMLRQAGVATVERLDLDTCGDPQRFFSYRRATHRGEPDYGRQISAIALTG